MQTRRPLFIVALALLVGIIGGLVGGSSPAFAVINIASTGTTTIPYGGTVRGAPEGVLLLGHVQFQITVINDPDFGTPPVVRLSIDFSHVTGVGVKTGMGSLEASTSPGTISTPETEPRFSYSWRPEPVR